MPSLPTTYNWGDSLYEFNSDLTRQLDRSYSKTARIVNTKVSKVSVEGSDPPASSDFNTSFDIGDIYVRTDTDSAWIMTRRTSSTAVIWTAIT